MFVASTIGGFSSSSVVVALVVVLVITIPGTFSAVDVIWTASVAAVAVSGVLSKVILLPGSDTVSARFFICREVASVSTSFPFYRRIEFLVVKF